MSGLTMRFFTQLFTAIALSAGLTGAAETKCDHYEINVIPIDLVIVMDESSSIGLATYKTALNAAAGLTPPLHIGTSNDDSRVGMVSFSDEGRVVFGLDQYTTNSDVTSGIQSATYNKGLTNIAAGMHVATTEVFAKASNRGVRKVMVVITDGMDITDVAAEHALAEKNGIVTYVLGVGKDINYEELVRAAGDPKRVFTFDNYEALANATCQIAICISSHGSRGCDCNYRHTWLDLIFILDSSKAVSYRHFTAVKNFTASFIQSIPVSQQIGKFSRVGIINMGDQAQVVGNLTSYSTPAQAANAMRNMQYLNSNQASLRDALTAATNMVSNDQRKNVQNVIVLFSSVQESCTYQGQFKQQMKLADQNPCRIASHLRENGNIIITAGLKYDDTEKYPVLNVGSDCYKLNFDIKFGQNFVDAICRANCYCLPPYVQFTDKCTEYGECVYQQGQPLDYFTADTTCKNYNATLIDVLSAEKDLFIRNMQGSRYNPYWIGAQYSNKQYEWSTGIQMTADSYKHWASGEPNIAKGDCVYEDINSGWYSDKCDYFMPAHYFVCQKKSCDTENYCDFEKNH